MKIFQELYKVIVRAAASTAERETLRTKKEIIKSLVFFFFPLSCITILAILSYWLHVSPLWYIACAIWAGLTYFVSFISAQIYGQVKGAKYALLNPRNGETWIEIIDDGESIWSSQKFIPSPALPEPLPIRTDGIRLPETFETWERWQRIYAHYRFLKTKEKRLNETDILARIHSDLSNENEIVSLTDRTLRDIRKAGEKGYLVSWETFCTMTGRPID